MPPDTIPAVVVIALAVGAMCLGVELYDRAERVLRARLERRNRLRGRRW